MSGVAQYDTGYYNLKWNFDKSETLMKKIIIGDHTYDIPDKVHILIEDLTDKNTRLRKKRKEAYREGWEDGARLGTYEAEHRAQWGDMGEGLR